ncbi:SUMF1/EgtB/PvdO family nonheme iron enzyme [Hyphobacterium sp. CCMP332]|nr:SUMF1/EgtB/PvdO family nonheme iron enzyme [Hyphobacterium sp. CCMP332]
MNYNSFIFLFLLIFPTLGYAQLSTATEPELIFVDGGEFIMGCSTEQNQQCISDEKPSVRVRLYDFWIGKYEVTNAQYAEFLSQLGNQTEGGSEWYRFDQYSLIKKLEDGSFQPIKGFEDYPVTNTSWYGAKAFTVWLSQQNNKYYRLPTEAEWEYAARGGQKSLGYSFSGSNTPDEVGWISDFAAESKTGWKFKMDKGVHQVGQKKANELGIYDMSGNVSEWCEDFYQNFYEAGINPMGADKGSLRVLRGGSWDNKPADCRVSARNYAQHVSRFAVNKGFRVVMENDISAQVNSFVAKNNFNGTILIKKKNRTIYHQSFGLANREGNIPNTNNTKYAIASITKLFTSVIVLQLIEEGKLELNKEISHYIPNYKGPAADRITIHHLLTHTSGIQNCEDIRKDNIGFPDIYLEKVSTDELLHKYCSGKQITEPGSRFDYNNGEYIILGKIIERIENDSFQNILKRRILYPLNMKNSGFITASSMTDDLAQGYKWNSEANNFEKDPERLLQNYFSAGAMYSTATDLIKFSDALYGRKLTDEKSLKLLLTTYPETREYGYGLWIRYPQYNKTVAKVTQRFGQIWGINTLISYFQDHDITVIVLANTDKVSVSEFQNMVGEEFLN